MGLVIKAQNDWREIGRQRVAVRRNCHFFLHCVSRKVPTFKLSVTLLNLNRFSNVLHC